MCETEMTPVLDLAVDPGIALVVPVDGELDIATVPALRQMLIDSQTIGRTVVVDLSDVTFIDASGLGELVGALKRARAKRGDLVLRDPARGVVRMLELASLATVFRVERTST
jgi:anti-anti-sigma factor